MKIANLKITLLENSLRLMWVLTLMNISATASCGQDGNAPQNQLPQTVAEASDFKSTSRSAEVVEFVTTCAEKADHVRRFNFGKTVEGREMVGAVVSQVPYELGDQFEDRNIVLLLGNIHSGECAGKEALLMMLRELTYEGDHPWLEKNVIIFAPNYNADGNDRVGKNNRPGQVGPVNGMGRRENAQQLDLNRDFSKIESPEARALIGLIDKVNPHLFVDCHTTNGSKHQYCLTYDVPHNPATAEPIRTFLREKMMPTVTRNLEEEKGQLTFYYGNLNAPNNTRWTTYGHEPRYSTEYVGLRGRLAILSEAYSYLDYKGRIIATKDFVSELLDFMTDNSSAVHQLLDSVEREFVKAAAKEPNRVAISLGATSVPFEERCVIKGFKDGKPFDYQCEFIGRYKSTKSTPLPYAYLIPAGFTRVVDRLLMHGVSVERLLDEQELEVQVDQVVTLDRAQRSFQRHKMVRLETERSTETQRLKAGTYVVRTAQPLGRWVSYMLESESDDGFAFWNFFDPSLQVGQPFPVLRVNQPAELNTARATKIEKLGLITLDMIDGPSRLLANEMPAPRWFGKTNWIKTSSWGRERLIDAVTASFVEQPANPYQAESVKLALLDAGIEEAVASELSEAKPIVSTNNRLAIFNAMDYSIAYFLSDSKTTKEAVVILGTPDAKAELFNFNGDESRLAYCTDQGLHFFDLETRKSQSVKAENRKHLIGKLDWVYQEELYGRGNFKGYWWQTGGDQVAFLKLDETPLFPFTVMDHMPVRGESEKTNYPKSGDPNPIVQVGVVSSVDPSSVFWVDLDQYEDEEILISGVTWSSNGRQLLIQVQNREQTWLDLVATDEQGGQPRVLFRDQTPAWIESPGDPIFLDSGEFLWRSPRSGYSHIYRYNGSGELVGSVTSGDWEVRSLIGVDSAKKFCYFTATRDNAIDVHAYRVNLSSGEIFAITTKPGTHAVDFSDDFTHFIDTWSDIDDPEQFTLCRNDGSIIRQFRASNDDRLNYLDIAQPQFLEIPSDNDQPMDAMLIKPPNFDPLKKYPVLVHIYAGPQAPRVRNRWGGQWYLWHQMLAQQGYVVWMCDNQSASYRSAKNVWPVHRNFAENELKDIEKGVSWLKSQSFVDADRIGVWGWSYGGYMTAYAMTRSKSFKMGISGAPVTDWKNYDSIYTERYMGLPKRNPKGYESTSVLYNNAANLHGKLLLIHGTVDDNVHLNNTMQFVKELQYANKQFELMLYPSNRHAIKDKKQAAHLRKLMTEFVIENL